MLEQHFCRLTADIGRVFGRVLFSACFDLPQRRIIRLIFGNAISSCRGVAGIPFRRTNSHPASFPQGVCTASTGGLSVWLENC